MIPENKYFLECPDLECGYCSGSPEEIYGVKCPKCKKEILKCSLICSGKPESHPYKKY